MKKAFAIIIGLFFAVAAQAHICCTPGNEASCCASFGKNFHPDTISCPNLHNMRLHVVQVWARNGVRMKILAGQNVLRSYAPGDTPMIPSR